MATKPKDTAPAMAILTIRGAAGMDAGQRAVVAEWLRKRADDVVINGKDYATKFVARKF